MSDRLPRSSGVSSSTKATKGAGPAAEGRGNWSTTSTSPIAPKPWAVSGNSRAAGDAAGCLATSTAERVRHRPPLADRFQVLRLRRTGRGANASTRCNFSAHAAARLATSIPTPARTRRRNLLSCVEVGPTRARRRAGLSRRHSQLSRNASLRSCDKSSLLP
jgi:hypothetical protein